MSIVNRQSQQDCSFPGPKNQSTHLEQRVENESQLHQPSILSRQQLQEQESDNAQNDNVDEVQHQESLRPKQQENSNIFQSLIQQNESPNIDEEFDKYLVMKQDSERDRKSSQNRKNYEEQESHYTQTKKKAGGANNFMKLVLAKKYQSNFINNLINRTYIRKLGQLSKYQISLLDSFRQLNKQDLDENDHCNFPCLSLNEWCQVIEVWDPSNMFIFCWDLFQINLIILIFLWLPFKISFNKTLIIDLFIENSTNKIIEIVFLCILACDVLVGCNLGFIYKGQVIKQRSKVIKNYLKNNSFVDVASLLSVSVSFFNNSNKLIESDQLFLSLFLCVFFYILRAKKIDRIQNKIQQFFNLNGSLSDMLGLFRTSIIIILIGHLCACSWHGIAYYQTTYPENWLKSYQLVDADDVTKYNFSFYWAVMTMTTVGFGDITPNNNYEMLVSTVTMFLACAVFAFSINTIGIVLQNLYKSTMEYSRQVTLINNYMHKNNVDFSLQNRIRSYLEYITQEEQEMNNEEISQVVQKLSSSLQDELQFQVRGNLLKKCKVIQNNFSEVFIKQLVNLMEEIRYSPEEKIIDMNIQDDNSIFFISKGEVNIFYQSSTHLKILKKGDSFGELSFFTENYRTATVFSNGFTKLFKLRREDFLAALEDYPEDFEKFHYLKDQILIYSDVTSMGLQCFSCKNKHLIRDCPIVHYISDKERIIKKDSFPHLCQRVTAQKRKFKSHFHALFKMMIVNEQAKRIQESNNEEDEDNELEDEEEEEEEENLQMIKETFEESAEEEDQEQNEEYQKSLSRLDQEMGSVLKSNEVRSQGRSMSRISQVPSHVEQKENDEEDYVLQNFFSNTNISFKNPKGNNGEERHTSSQLQLQIPEIKEESDEESKRKKKKHLTVTRKGNEKKTKRQPQQKKTFKQIDMNLSDELPIARNNSNRSQTFTVSNKSPPQIQQMSQAIDKPIQLFSNQTNEVETIESNAQKQKRKGSKLITSRQTIAGLRTPKTEGMVNSFLDITVTLH